MSDTPQFHHQRIGTSKSQKFNQQLVLQFNLDVSHAGPRAKTLFNEKTVRPDAKFENG